MTRAIYYFLCAFVVTAVTSWAGNKNYKVDTKAAEIKNAALVQTVFPFPDIPATLTRPEERKVFLMIHYWDKFDFADTLLVNNRNISEQGFADQLSILMDGSLQEKTVRESIDNFCAGMERHDTSRRIFMEMADEYLYNTDSPYYNEWLYGIYLERMMDSRMVEDVQKSSLKFRLELLKKNQPGQKAEDFVYYTSDGKKHSLLDTPMNGEYMMLVLYSPECMNCKILIERMKNDDVMAKAVDNGRLTILTVYTEDNELVWRDALKQMPEKWIAGQDKGVITSGALYDMKEMPSVYLLDKDRKVVLKHASLGDVRNMLNTGTGDAEAL